MVNYDFKNDCILIRKLLKLSQKEFADELGVSFATINRIENGRVLPSKIIIERIFDYAFSKNVRINSAKAEIMSEESDYIFFHGTNVEITGEIDLNHSKKKTDFGQGFYLGETYKQAATYVSGERNGSVYVFKFDESKLNIVRFGVDLEWMLAISYYRETLNPKYHDKKMIKNLIDRIENADVIIAPIADNSVYEILNQFSRGDITDLQASHSLSASYLGDQHVIKSIKSLEFLMPLQRLYLCEKEKQFYIDVKVNEDEHAKTKVEASKIKYRRQGKYIEEILDETN